MNELTLFKCKNCGAELDPSLATDGVIECKFCRTPWAVPRTDTTPEALKYLHDGNSRLDTCKFDDAYMLFQKAADLNKKEPEAYFGMALAGFKIQYLKDSVNNRLQPICHEVTKRKIFQDRNYQKAISYATPTQRTEYERKAADIDYICDQFYRIAQTGLHYDSFICVKVTDDETGNHTTDSKDADYIYRLLKEHGYSPFYSEYEIRNKTGTDYEAHILYALYSSECMLVVCNNEAFLQTKWVKNEYTRFLKLVSDEEKESDSVTIVFHGAPIEKLPGKRGKIQGIDFSLREADNKILDFVENHTPSARERRQELLEERQKAEEQRRQEEEKIRQQIEQLNQRLQSVQNVSGGGAMATVQSLLTRAEQELAADSFDRASVFYDRVLEADPFNGYAWWGMLLIEYHVKSEEFILKDIDWQTAEKIENDRNFLNASKYADDILKERIKAFLGGLQDPKRWWNVFLAEMGVSDEKEILNTITAEKIDFVNRDRNYALAKKHAKEDFAARIATFEEGLYSAETNWTLFLQSHNVSHENELFESMTPETLLEIESNALYRTASREAQGELGERLNTFALRLHSGEFWWEKFLKERNVSSSDEIVANMTPDTIEEVEGNALYQNAVKYATGEFGESLRAFRDELYSGERWWRRFLADFKVEDEQRLLAQITPEIAERIENNRDYRCACLYAEGEMRERVDRFGAQLVSAEVWWKALLSALRVEDEEEFFASPEKIANPRIYDWISKNGCYLKAVKYAEGEMKERIESFMKRLRSAEFWWKAFLRRLGLSDEREFFANLTPDSVERAEFDEYYRNAHNFAQEESKRGGDGELLKKIVAFDTELHSYELWWNAFLQHAGVSSEQELLRHYTYESDARILSDPYFLKAERFANDEQREAIATLRRRIQAHHKKRQEAENAWAALLKFYRVSSEEGLNGLFESIKSNPSYATALQKAKSSESDDLVLRYERVAQTQEGFVKRNKRSKFAQSAASFFEGFFVLIVDILVYLGVTALFVLCVVKAFSEETFLWIDWGKAGISSVVSAIAICLFGLVYQIAVMRYPKRSLFGGVTYVLAFGLFLLTEYACVKQDYGFGCHFLAAACYTSVGLLFLRMGVKPSYLHCHIWAFLPVVCLDAVLLGVPAAADQWIVTVLCLLIFVFLLTMLPHELYGNLSRSLFCVGLLAGCGVAMGYLASASATIGAGDFFSALFTGLNVLWTILYLAALIVAEFVVTKLVRNAQAKKAQKHSQKR